MEATNYQTIMVYGPVVGDDGQEYDAFIDDEQKVLFVRADTSQERSCAAQKIAADEMTSSTG